MTADPAALRELAQGLPSTPTLADAAHWVGVVAEDREGYLYLSAAGSLWQSVGGMDWDTADLAKRDSSVKRLPVPVDQLAAVRAALEGAAAGLERDRAERDRLRDGLAEVRKALAAIESEIDRYSKIAARGDAPSESNYADARADGLEWAARRIREARTDPTPRTDGGETDGTA